MDQLDRLDPRGLGHAAAAVLRHRILSGALRPGDQIPSETALIGEFGVSRTVVREAVAELRAGGLVETYHGRGSIVLDVAPEQPTREGWLDIRGPDDLRAMIDLRLGVETEAAALAAQHRTAAQLAALQRAMDVFERLHGDRSQLVKADFEIHQRVAAASGNRYFVELMDSLGPTVILFHRTNLREGTDVSDEAHFAVLVHEHRAVCDAIARQDPDGARAAMRMHLRRSRAVLAHGGGMGSGRTAGPGGLGSVRRRPGAG